MARGIGEGDTERYWQGEVLMVTGTGGERYWWGGTGGERYRWRRVLVARGTGGESRREVLAGRATDGEIY